MNPRVRLFNYEVDPLTMDGAVAQLLAWVAAPGSLCRYVVTPNVNHTVLLERHAGLRAAYRDAGLVLVDGMPIYLAARLAGRPIPGRVAGSDLVPRLFDEAERTGGVRAYLLGAGPGVAARAARHIHERWPKSRVVGTNSPPIGFERDKARNEAILQEIEDARPDVLIVGLGAPKQELWVHDHRQRLAASVALCVGATIDFLAGEKRRAPRWMRQAGLEWLHRAASEPRRLLKRYGRDAWAFFWLLCRYGSDVGGKSTWPS
jgi:N-acetylglucosaminyldiphosphoundecaprenol N-acetyl-beta-D-mannosaminyltransferase